jgi:UDP-N-acetylglucosamine 4,6-dehydratase/5-epimerase
MRILVTGGTGSFGQAFVKRVLEAGAERVVVFSRDEVKQSEMAQEFPDCRYFIGDVRDLSRLEMAMRGVEYVIHTAALKQVPSCEYNPFEAIHTNVLGAENVVQAAIRCGVNKTIALSTDKAANPINLYGASKLAADKIFIAANNLSGTKGPRFSVVRYGNVVGSRGSVVPFFRKLIEDKVDYLPITDRRMTRFWITLDQGVEFVSSCLHTMRGGEIFVPKLPSTRIVDLARAMAPHLPHKDVGIRPGEKLHETLVTEGDACTAIEWTDRYIVEPAFAYWTREPFEGRKVLPDFRYQSDTNPQGLDESELQLMLMTA